MITAHYKMKNGKIKHFNIKDIAEVANIIDNLKNYHNSSSNFYVYDDNGIIGNYDLSLGSFVYDDFRNLTLSNFF